MNPRPKILSIAGFDPSGGAGVLADVKTFEQHKVLGMGISTANTIQNENEFIAVNWIDETQIFSQLEILIKKHTFQFVKIGLVPNLQFLIEVLNRLCSGGTKIIWDPILSSSSGFDFKHDLSELNTVLKKIFLITPNWNETKTLSAEEEAMRGAKKLSKLTKVYLKGGHNSEQRGKDFLFTNGKVFPFNPKGKKVSEKHGSGCVFSSALAANLTKGYPIVKACLQSKEYVTKVLESNESLLGYHK
ncbi:MAG: hydroxymethylpyrimidine/phosphomethylpyrimidine kinase [Flavobacteriales bacterium]|nr:hydroxymethylpyrimidine/phosphomethylpyrimidine kinase [Flavobacteriales bacterium]